MNTQSDVLPESSRESLLIASAEIPLTRRMYWALRRELWENRAIYIAPLAAAGVALLGFLLTLAHLPARMRRASTLGPMELHKLVEQPFDAAAALLMGTFLLVAFFYCLEALQRERRDRSILFWKSLPVSDLTTVAAKASIPFVVLPMLVFAINFATQFLMLLLSGAVLAASGLGAARYWGQVSLFPMSLLLLYHIVTVHLLWSAPVYGWLLLVSAWARRAAFLWAVLPPLAIGALEKLLFNTAHFGAFLEHFLSGSGTEAFAAPDSMPMDPLTHITPIRFLTTPGLWLGLAVTAACLAAAVRLRRCREPN
jgi:ABC-2 type transport system permease protein